ncbi:MAG: hypothetical protein WAN65_07315 [Candidatus Sulfotelmatobacter sp.]
MSKGIKLTGLLLAGTLCLPVAGQADTQTTHRTHVKAKKQEPPPPLPSGTQGPVPQVPLDAIPAIAPQVSFQDGLLTIVAPNSTLGDILRGVRKHTSADIEIPPTASERVVTRLGPGPAREVLSELLNGSRFNYILLGSPEDANALVRVVLVAKAVEAPAGTAAPGAAGAAPVVTNAPSEAAEEPADEPVEEQVDQGAVEAEQAAGQQQPDQPPVKTPQQMLQEMQQRQLQMQQQQQSGQAGQGVQPGPYPMPPGIPRPPQQQQPPDNE